MRLLHAPPPKTDQHRLGSVQPASQHRRRGSLQRPATEWPRLHAKHRWLGYSDLESEGATAGTDYCPGYLQPHLRPCGSCQRA
jgi:hypothetical protein